MNKIAMSPNSLIGVPALEYIDALVKAGYDGIGLRTYASPKDQDPKLFLYTQIRDGSPTSGPGADPRAGAPTRQPAMGKGSVPLGDILDALPTNIPLSIEWSDRESGYSAAEWAKIALDGTRAFMDDYYAAREGTR